MQCDQLLSRSASMPSLKLIGSKVNPKYGLLPWNTELPFKHRPAFHPIQDSLLDWRIKSQGQRNCRELPWIQILAENLKPWATRWQDGGLQSGHNNRKSAIFSSSSLIAHKFLPYFHDHIQPISTQMVSHYIRGDFRLHHTDTVRVPRRKKAGRY